MQNPLRRVTLVALMLFMFGQSARASLTTDLQSFVSDLNALSTQLAGISVDGVASCSQIGSLNTSIEDYAASIEMLTGELSAPLSLTPDDMTSLDDMSSLSRSMANDAVRLSWELRDIESIQALIEYRTALSAMLRLAADIGTMADRILEMANRILLMADNIGAMADRILITQTLQNSNIALTQSALLTTMNNMVQLSDSVSSIEYNLSLGLLSGQTQALADDMAGVVLTQTNMAAVLATLESTTTSVLNQAVNIYTNAIVDSQNASHFINGDTLTLLCDLSKIQGALATSLETYALAIELLAPVTDNVVLRDATASMLRLTRDIGLMSDRITEMTDKIMVMADNIGSMSGRIVETQNIQQANVLLTESSILSAQSIVVSTIDSAGL